MRNLVIFAAFLAALAGLNSTASQSSAQGFANVQVVLRNSSPYTVKVGIYSNPVQNLAPGREILVYRSVWFRDPVNYIQGSQSIPITVRYNGVTRTGSIPIYARGGYAYSSGGIIRRSPGIVGVVNAGSP